MIYTPQFPFSMAELNPLAGKNGELSPGLTSAAAISAALNHTKGGQK